MIDPNFWESEDVSKLTIRQRLLLIGLFSNADDYGRGRAKPTYIRSVVFPYDDISVEEIQEDLEAIKRHISIVFYEVDGNSYYEFLNWNKWQTVQKPQRSMIPSYRDVVKKNDSGISQESFRNNSENDSENDSKIDSGISQEEIKANSRLKEKKRREEKGKEEKGENDSGIILATTQLQMSDYERDIIAELHKVENYPADEAKDLELIRSLAEEYPTVELLLEARKWRTYKLDNPLIPGKSNPRSQFRTWIRKAAEWQQNKDARAALDEPAYIPPYWKKYNPDEEDDA